MLRAAVIVVLLALLPSHAQAEARIALLIGNEAYASEIGRLANPHNDVALLEQALKGLGFEVVTVRDAGLGTLYQAVNVYARRLQTAGPTAVGFFYYSGHGASDGSTNYLIPVDVKTIDTGELWDQSLRLTEIMRKLKNEAGNATHFVVFDACRNTLKLRQPRSRAVMQSKGFVPVAQESGMLVAYATAEGELASDVGLGAGPYAMALVEEIVKPGVEAVVMFRTVQRRVRAAIKQEPYLGFNAIGDVYLGGKPDAATSGHLGTASNATAREWQDVKDTNSIAVLKRFAAAHKNDPVYSVLAQNRIDAIRRAQQAIAQQGVRERNPCGMVAGTWTMRWSASHSIDVVLRPDGFATRSDDPSRGRWKCEGRSLVIQWNDHADRGALSPDGKLVSGQGALPFSMMRN